MARYGWRIDRFSTIDHLTEKQLKDDELVLSVLRESPRVSTFEMSGMKGVYRAIRRLERAGRIRLTDMPYPWHGVEIIDPPSREVP